MVHRQLLVLTVGWMGVRIASSFLCLEALVQYGREFHRSISRVRT
jgi:hypothetical protein